MVGPWGEKKNPSISDIKCRRENLSSPTTSKEAAPLGGMRMGEMSCALYDVSRQVGDMTWQPLPFVGNKHVAHLRVLIDGGRGGGDKNMTKLC